MIRSNFPDALDARMHDIFDGNYKQVPDRIGDFFSTKSPGDSPQKQDIRGSSNGALGDVPEFSGTITYDDAFEGYDWTIVDREYASGLQIQRRLFDDALVDSIEAKPRGLALALARTRQKHAASIFNNGFSIDTTWLNHTEGVAMCSNSHTTRATGVSTAAGFDNLVTTAMSSVSVIAARLQMKGYRDDRANFIDNEPDTLIYPHDLEATAEEIRQSQGYPEEVTNAKNFNEGRYTGKPWLYLTDANNWFMADMRQLKSDLLWWQRLSYELDMIEDFDSLVGKWRLYERHGLGWKDWRGILGAQVS
jgi:hypothetical protein